MWFEDMRADFDSELEKLQNFLGTKVSGEKLVELKKRVHIDNMQAKGVQELGGPGTPMGPGRPIGPISPFTPCSPVLPLVPALPVSPF